MGNSDPAFKLAATIAANASVSSGVKIIGLSPLGFTVRVPSGWTAANIGFQVSDDDVASQDLVTNWDTLYDDTGTGVKISGIVTSASGRYLAPVTALAGVNARWIRIISRSTSDFTASVNQVSPMTLSIYVVDG